MSCQACALHSCIQYIVYDVSSLKLVMIVWWELQYIMHTYIDCRTIINSIIHYADSGQMNRLQRTQAAVILKGESSHCGD